MAEIVNALDQEDVRDNAARTKGVARLTGKNKIAVAESHVRVSWMPGGVNKSQSDHVKKLRRNAYKSTGLPSFSLISGSHMGSHTKYVFFTNLAARLVAVPTSTDWQKATKTKCVKINMSEKSTCAQICGEGIPLNTVYYVSVPFATFSFNAS